MSRLTIRAEEDGVKAVWYGERDVFLEGEIGYAEADKLAHYEDLEKQGRLIELPCAVGDTVYWISESDACLFCNGPCYERCEEGALKIKEIPFKPHMLNEIGEIIFLTKEEAEAKLAEMEGAE